MDGVLILDKPAGMTSHDAVNRLRRITGERSIGHLGTLDPMATGVLPMLLGRMTRLAQFYLHCGKEYEGEICLGFATDTYDATGEQTGPQVEVSCPEGEIREAAAKFVGVIEQMPPPYSAKKIAGVPAYKLARRNQPVELKPVKVEIKKFEISSVQGDRLAFRAQVASGTYLRSLAHDLGRELAVGGHLASLRRTAVGEFKIEDACNLEELAGKEQNSRPSTTSDNEYPIKLWPFVPEAAILPGFPRVTGDDLNRAKLAHGQSAAFPCYAPGRYVRVFDRRGCLVAVAERIAGVLFRPKVNLGRI
jgi:tRNA pseudouridine55 synthase